MPRPPQRPLPIALALAATTSIGFLSLYAQKPSVRSGIDSSATDPSIRAQDDLFRHINGTWLKKTEIPAERASYGSFIALADKAESDLRAIIEETSQKPNNPQGSEAQKVGNLFAAFLNEEAAEKLGLAPIADDLALIDKIQAGTDLAKVLGQLAVRGTNGLFSAFVNTDAKNSTRYVVYIDQAGIGLPDESYYRDDKFLKIRSAYVQHIANILKLAGSINPEGDAARVMSVETLLAKSHWDRVRRRDDTLTYNKKTAAELAAITPGFDWSEWSKAVTGKPSSEIGDIIVQEPSFFEAMAKAVGEVPAADWRLWARWHVLHEHAPLLTKAFVDESFNFFGKTLTGTPQQRPRWKRGVSAVESALGEAVGKIYVEKHFPPQAKERMKTLVANLVEAYRESISELQWMSPETRKKALEKLSKFTPKIGYPDQWRDYSSLEIKRNDLVGNMRRAHQFELNRSFNKLGKPVDKSEWFMTPQTVNAYYNPGLNEIVFPAAILQPPFFDLNADDAINYGGIGAVIGHEIGHGFDDQGSKFDGDGNMNNWWTDQDRKEFEARAKMLIDQYNGFSPVQLPDQKVNGALTIGENIGDLGGLSIGYRAYIRSLKSKPAPVIDGLNGAQRLFIGWGQIWRTKYRDTEMMRRLTVDSHSPPEFRCNGVIRNLPEFYEAFGVKQGDRLWLPKEKRVRIW
ncbi:MAG: peptidase M13 [Planctomycetota bacterium]|nr:MAG: peptidase M13 [Planctomycetota bacterium]